jgi:predicted ATP-dependent endonuclease of OLD family
MEFEEINKIRSQFNSGLWPKFLDSIKIEGLRGLSGQTINFRFPVTAIVGENGTRKSTFLKAAVCAYVGSKNKNFLSEYFLSTYWDTITDVDIWYTVHQGPQILSFRNGKGKKKWSYSSKRPKREVFFFSISRNLPKEVSIGYAKIARFTTSEISTKELRPEIKERLSHIMGRKYTGARFIVPDIDQRKQIGLLKRDDCCEISSFHQGAGEDATHDLMKVLQDVPDTSLVIIDEVEASLHPKAQRRLIRFLLWLSRQKRIQIILSTHSPYILEELPQEARIMLLPNTNGMEVIYGVSPEFALSNLDDTSRVIYLCRRSCCRDSSARDHNESPR